MSLTDEEMGLLDSNQRRTLNEDFTDEQLKQIIKMVATSTGIYFSQECLYQLETSPAKLFEFTISDIAEMKPVVKHMHQVSPPPTSPLHSFPCTSDALSHACDHDH